MASSRPANSTGGDGSINSLIIPKIASESKRRVLTDAIHYCFKQMLENSLAVSTVSESTSTLAKLIGQEMFFRIVKMIYDIQFNVNKEVIDSRGTNREEVLSNQTSVKEVFEEVRVKREAPSLMAEESNINSENGSGAYTLSRDERQSTVIPLSVQGKNREETSTEDIRVKREPQSPLSFTAEESDINTEYSDGTYSLSQDERQSTVIPLSVQEKTKELKSHQVIRTQGKTREETSSVSTEQVIEDKRIRCESPLPIEEESDISSEDGDSTYYPSEDEKPRPPVPFSIKEKVVRAAELNPNWSIKSLQQVSRRLRRKSEVKTWKKQLEAGGNKFEKFSQVSNWVLERAKKAKENSVPVTRRKLNRWGVEASELYSVKGFTVCSSWIYEIMKRVDECT